MGFKVHSQVFFFIISSVMLHIHVLYCFFRFDDDEQLETVGATSLFSTIRPTDLIKCKKTPTDMSANDGVVVFGNRMTLSGCLSCFS